MNKIYSEISRLYAEYIKYYLNTSLKTEILCLTLAEASDNVRNISNEQLIKDHESFKTLANKIFSIFAHATECNKTRLFSNVVFMLFKDLIKIYKVYYVHVNEMLERFPQMTQEDA